MNKDLVQWLERKNQWSIETFGTAQRWEGVLRHIESELEEIRETPNDLMEWVDVILLALDGAYRSGHTAEEIVEAIYTKQEINMSRKWAVANDNEPSFHVEENN